jgi:Tfp pilus assembly PilM family ATPase
MSITPRSLVVDCGAAHVAIARFTCDRAGRLGLEALAVEVHAAEPGTDARWIGQVREAAAAAGEREKLRGPCRVALPGHLALTKLVAAPACDPAQRRSAWALAAAQAMPFPLDELAWDVREIAGNGADDDLALAAAKSAWMNELGAALIAARLEPTQAEPVVLSLARAYRYNYADATDAALVVDLGARSMSMIWAAPDGRFRLRTVALGGNAITRALAEKWGVDFTTAEARKRQWLDTGDQAAPDPATDAAVGEAGEHWLQRLRFEIGRMLAGAARGDRVPAPARVLLTGGGSLWPGLAERLAAGLGITVEAYDGLRRVELPEPAERAALEALRHHLPPLVGLAAIRLETGPAALNLLTPRLQSRQRLRRRRPWFLAAAATFAAACAGAVWQGQAAVAHTRRELATVAAEIASLRQSAEADAAAQASLLRMQTENAQLRRWLDDRDAWAEWLGDLQACLGAHGEVWLDHVSLKAATAETESGPLGIEIGGWLLDLRHPLMPPGTEALARLHDLLSDLTALPPVSAVADEHHDRSRPGRLGFGCTLVLAPEHRL